MDASSSIPSGTIDPEIAFRLASDRQNFALGAAGGLVAMLAGTSLWVAITVLSNYQFGYMAVGVGFLVGLGVQKLGRGFEPRFRYLGAGLTLIGCVLGNLFTGCELIAMDQKVGFARVVSVLTPVVAWDILAAMFSPMDILFYALGAMAGWKYSAVGAPPRPAAPALRGT